MLEGIFFAGQVDVLGCCESYLAEWFTRLTVLHCNIHEILGQDLT